MKNLEQYNEQDNKIMFYWHMKIFEEFPKFGKCEERLKKKPEQRKLQSLMFEI